VRVHVISDLHLDAVSHGVPRREEILRSVDVSLAQIRKGDVLVVNGDITDPGTNRSYQAISDAIEIDRKAKALGASTVEWLVGNHDIFEDGSGGSVLGPLIAAGCNVHGEPTLFEHEPLDFLALPYVPIAKRYDPEEVLRDLLPKKGPVFVFGHLNLEGITPGSEVTLMARGREVYWPKSSRSRSFDPRILYVGGHIHRAQEYDGVEIVGSPDRFDAGEADHNPMTFIAAWTGKKWTVDRKRIEESVQLRRYVDCDQGDRLATTGIFRAGDFVRAIDEGENRQEVEKQGAIFVSIPKAVAASPKATVSRESKKHRRVREVVLDVARAYPSTKDGLLERVEKTMTEAGL